MVGGSLAGLFAGNLLHRAGWEVDVFERAAEPLAGRGAGIITHAELFRVLERCGVAVDDTLGCQVPGRVAFSPRGDVLGTHDAPQLLTTWGRLHEALLACFPAARYHLGKALNGFRLADGGGVVATFADGTSTEGTILVAADGIRSTVRRHLLPQVEPAYAGYVGWRGLAREATLSAKTRASLGGRFAFCLTPTDQILAYPVAGAAGSVAPGERDYNVVWYRPVREGDELRRLCTDAVGRVHAGGMPPPLIRPAVLAEIVDYTASHFAPPLAEIVARSREPFFQAISDVESPRMAVGRVALIGDAPFVARPHVGVGVVKAAGDAVALVEALVRHPGEPAEALAAFERERLPFGRWAVERARALGNYLEARTRPSTLRPEAVAHHTSEAVMREVGVPLETVEPPGLREPAAGR